MGAETKKSGAKGTNEEAAMGAASNISEEGTTMDTNNNNMVVIDEQGTTVPADSEMADDAIEASGEEEEAVDTSIPLRVRVRAAFSAEEQSEILKGNAARLRLPAPYKAMQCPNGMMIENKKTGRRVVVGNYAFGEVSRALNALLYGGSGNGDYIDAGQWAEIRQHLCGETPLTDEQVNELWAMGDGYGKLTAEEVAGMLYDFTHIKASSVEAKRAIADALKNMLEGAAA